ncbi:DUF1212-domain-containing protein [Sistotremastrum niveocremeum HHB9708]|nr:DUF1212-domain-containing protein [Sistotremastrum niveocremeum HHB9708]
MSRANSETSRWEYDHRRALSSDEPIDADDPIFTGAKPNRIDQDRRDQKDRERERSARFSAIDSDGREKKPQKRRAEKQRVIIQKNICSVLQRQNFVLKLAKALMTFGAPSHRIESQLAAAARILEIDAQFVHIPSVVIASFGDQESKGSDTHFVKAGGGLALGKLHKVHTIYRQVVHDEIGAEEGMQKLHNLLRAKPQYGIAIKCLLSFFCAALICPLAFGGSFIDMWIAGAAGAFLAFLQLRAATKSALYANVFEISVAIMVSFVARALSSIPSGIFCYNAISSAGVVLILPGYLILCSSLELASKNIVCGSVRMVYAIIYSLFLGFGLTIGSDLYLLIDSHARHRQAAATAGLAAVTILNGNFSSSNMTSPYGNFYGTFTFSNTTAVSSTESSIVTGCLRSTADPWWLRAFPGWTLFITVPMFSILSSLNNQQPLLSKQLPVMVVISCASFAANKAANHYIFNRSDVVSAIGAFVVGVLGNAYSRVFGGTAFTSMVTGVLFLVPSGLSAAGGLSDNYRSGDQDQFSNGLEIGMRMVQVGIGITVGLFGSGLFIYSFGSRKQAALFAF